MTRNLPRLAGAVQRNCDISDARYAGDYGLCTFLLKMREYYRWESDLPLSRTLSKDEIGDWLAARERMWDRVEADAYAPLPLEPGELDAFDAAAANRELLPQGCVYGAGYGRFHKPVFFLGRLLRVRGARRLHDARFFLRVRARAGRAAGDAAGADHLRAPGVRAPLPVGEDRGVAMAQAGRRDGARARGLRFRRRRRTRRSPAWPTTRSRPWSCTSSARRRPAS